MDTGIASLFPPIKPEFVVELPFPDSILNGHANGNSHWAKSKPTKSARELGFAMGLVAKSKHPGVKFIDQRAGIVYLFYPPKAGRRDTANCIGACKPYIDGLVDAKILADDSYKHLLILGAELVGVDAKNPRVEIFLQKVPDYSERRA